MLSKRFTYLVSEALKEKNSDKELFVSEYSQAGFHNGSDEASSARECEKAWEIAHACIKEIIEKSEMSNVTFADRFCIGRSTVNAWLYRGVKPATHLILLISESLGFLNEYKK